MYICIPLFIWSGPETRDAAWRAANTTSTPDLR